MAKKLFLSAVFIFILIGAGIFVLPKETVPVPSLVPEATQPTVVVVINNGEAIATYSGILAATPFDALVRVSVQESITVQTKQYDFGVFVESIGNIKGSADRAWIYFVNGVSGTVAADKHELTTGDIVEWKFIQPSY